MGEPVMMNLFPATVTFPDAQILKDVRVVITGTRLTVWDRKSPKTRAPALEDVAVEIKPPREKGAGYSVVLQDGTTWEVRKEGRCGCGSPLKRFNPVYAGLT